ncbi:phosphatase PAP2 family protein [Variovorax sp. J22R133]|uniref:phosphatase PAP2 family protein n=1 Tax=Variovorax brevis TaxID=3053503 RepID=UPI002577BD63|nr:phosphatase PAP2 family protein [Variovorax sp. J22R133]MDM0111130.1 phosphatase PAP2 family protein [Variovorax sp. J22R133]
MQALNIELFEWINHSHAPEALLLWFASHGALLCALLVVGVLCLRPRDGLYAFGIVVAAAVAALVVHGLARAIDEPRPFMLGLGTLRMGHGPRGAMPSAHAAVMFTCALLMLQRPSLRLAGLVALALAAITGWARVYAGVHFPFDIVGGLLLAAVIAAGARLVSRLWLAVAKPQLTQALNR